MADVSALPLMLRGFLRAYPWRRIDPVPCARLEKPMAACRNALVSTAGLVPAGAPPFEPRVRGGDHSYPVIPRDDDVRGLVGYHRSESYDHTGIARDRNLAFPLDRLCELAAEGVIGEVAPRHLSFMGSITAPGGSSATRRPKRRRSSSGTASTSHCSSPSDRCATRSSAWSRRSSSGGVS